MDPCNVCGKASRMVCPKCKSVAYCGEQHRKQNESQHRAQCTMMASNPECIDQGREGEYMGTFRWAAQTKFIALPPFPARLPSLADWEDYLDTRFSNNEQQQQQQQQQQPPAAAAAGGGGKGKNSDESENNKVVVEPQMIDGLSYPLSLARAMTQLRQGGWLARQGEITIYVIGASSRTEERIARETNYFDELTNFFPTTNMTMTLVGPEVSASEENVKVIKGVKGGQLTINCVRGPLSSLPLPPPLPSSSSSSQPSPSRHLYVGFNTGMGCGNLKLMRDWLCDISSIVENGRAPAVFTCANDYSDVRGEVLMMERVHRARFIIPPHPSPFSSMTTLHEPGQMQSSWSRGNSFVYAVFGNNNNNNNNETIDEKEKRRKMLEVIAELKRGK